MQLHQLRQLVEPYSLRRPRSLLGGAVLPAAEVRVPVGLTPSQAAAYRAVLTVGYEYLADPKPSRYSGYRAAQLRTLCTELRNVCCHPALSDLAEQRSGNGSGSGAEQPAGGAAAAAAGALADTADTPVGADRLVAGSAKLALLDSMLRTLRAAGRRVMVLAQSPRALDAVEQLARERYGGTAAYERVDATTKTAARQEAVQRFNAACDASRWLFLQHTRSCGLGTDLPGIDAAIFLDSDWSARKDAQALSHALRVGSPERLRVYRLYCRGTCEERLLQLSDKLRGLDALCQQSQGRWVAGQVCGCAGLVPAPGACPLPWLCPPSANIIHPSTCCCPAHNCSPFIIAAPPCCVFLQVLLLWCQGAGGCSALWGREDSAAGRCGRGSSGRQRRRCRDGGGWCDADCCISSGGG